MIIGLFSLAQSTAHFKAVQEGLVAGKFAFEVIDREPIINDDDETAEKYDFKGEIEF